MRVKLNKADEYYIFNHCLKMTVEEISKEIDLSEKSFSEFYELSIENVKQLKIEEEEKKRKEEQKKRTEDGFTVMTQNEADSADSLSKKSDQDENKNQSHIWRSNE